MGCCLLLESWRMSDTLKIAVMCLLCGALLKYTLSSGLNFCQKVFYVCWAQNPKSISFSFCFYYKFTLLFWFILTDSTYLLNYDLLLIICGGAPNNFPIMKHKVICLLILSFEVQAHWFCSNYACGFVFPFLFSYYSIFHLCFSW